MGWTLDVAGAIDLPRLQRLRSYWEKRPPAHVSLHQIAVFLGAMTAPVSGPERSGASMASANGLGELLEQFPAIPPPDDVDLEALSIDERRALAQRMFFGDVLTELPKA